MESPSSPTCCAPRVCGKPSIFTAKCRQMFVAGTWGLLTNVERAIIMPSLWLYLKSGWGEQAALQYYASTVAAFSLAVLLVTPVVGYAAHRKVRTRVILMISNLFEILGNVLYLVGRNPWVLLLARFISGVGASCDPPLYADMVRLTSMQERTTYVIALLLPKLSGLLFGPAFTLLVHNLSLRFGTISVTVYNVPGLAMAILWGLHILVVLLVYPDVGEVVRRTAGAQQPDTLLKRIHAFICEPSVQQDQVASTDGKAVESSVPAVSGDLVEKPRSQCASSCADLKPYRQFDIITLYMIAFTVNFSVFCLEAVLPAVVQRLYQWNEVQVSWVYLAGGTLVILVFLIVRCLTICLTDRAVLTTGLLVLLVAYLWLTFHLAEVEPKPDRVTSVAFTMAGLFLYGIGLPMVGICCESLYTKLSPTADMDRAQAIYRTVVNMAFLAGPFVGGVTVDRPYISCLIVFILVLLPMASMCSIYDLFLVEANNNGFDGQLI